MTKLIVMACIGALSGFFAPAMADRLVEMKEKQKGRKLSGEKLYLSFLISPFWWKVISVAVSAAGLGFCGYCQPSWINLILVAIMWTIGLVTMIVDNRVRLIPNEAVLALFVVGAIFRFINGGFMGLLNSLITMLVVGIVWIILAMFMGFYKVGAGDVKLSAVIAFVFGYPGALMPLMVMAVGLLVYCLYGMLMRMMSIGSTFPMGPFIIMGLLAGFPLMYIL